jgi:hypothetical protein
MTRYKLTFLVVLGLCTLGWLRQADARNHVDTGNFRRQAVLKASGVKKSSYEHPPGKVNHYWSARVQGLSVAVNKSWKNVHQITSRLERGSVRVKVVEDRRTGKVVFVAAPLDKRLKPRVLSDAEVTALGVAPQPTGARLAARGRGKYGSTTADQLKPSGLSNSGLSYVFSQAPQPTSRRPSWLRDGHKPVLKVTRYQPITGARHGKSASGSISSIPISE